MYSQCREKREGGLSCICETPLSNFLGPVFVLLVESFINHSTRVLLLSLTKANLLLFVPSMLLFFVVVVPALGAIWERCPIIILPLDKPISSSDTSTSLTKRALSRSKITRRAAYRPVSAGLGENVPHHFLIKD